jgi:nucleoside phosphorylase
MVGIVYATRREAAALLSQTSAVLLAAHPFQTFRADGAGRPPCLVAVSGMGKVAAAAAASHLVLAHRVSMLVNAGLCGRLTADHCWSVGDLLRIRSAVEGDCDRFGRPEPPVACDTRWFRRLAPARLVTCDRPVFDAEQRSRLAALGELADMEGAAVARVAGLYGLACAMVKGISDVADQTGRTELARNIDWVSERIANALVSELSTHLIQGHET